MPALSPSPLPARVAACALALVWLANGCSSSATHDGGTVDSNTDPIAPGDTGNDSREASSETAGETARETAGETAAARDSSPIRCPASLAGDTPLGTDVPPDPSRWKVTQAITFLDVGGSGSYDRVVDMAPGTWPPPCADPRACVKATKAVSGPLVPFDEEMTMVFSGPIELYEIAVYEPGPSGFSRVSYWNRCTSDNLVFMNNLGGGDVSGVWTVCGGNSQSYASADGEQAAVAPTPFAGSLADGVGVNVMTAKPCQGAGDTSDCGFYRDVGLHGWKGSSDGTKVFAVKLRMPVGTKTPAYWILPAQVVRTAQYGCNCRGMGGAGGCGELDVAEVLPSEDAMAATTTIYSWKSVRNGNGWTFQRPALASAVLVVIFDGRAGTIALRRMPATTFAFDDRLESAQVAAWQADAGVTSTM